MGSIGIENTTNSFQYFFGTHLLCSDISKTGYSGSSGYPNTKKRVENMMHSAIFLTKFEVFG